MSFSQAARLRSDATSSSVSSFRTTATDDCHEEIVGRALMPAHPGKSALLDAGGRNRPLDSGTWLGGCTSTRLWIPLDSPCANIRRVTEGANMEIDLESIAVILGLLAKIVVLSMLLERALAFVFEFEWVARILTAERTPDGRAEPSTTATSRVPGLKAAIAFGVSWYVCRYYEVDAFAPLFNAQVSPTGTFLTAMVVAGGSAAAIGLFQGVFGFAKSTRELNTQAREAEAEARQSLAKARKIQAETEAKLANEALKRLAEA
jgi:hypothetical protein